MNDQIVMTEILDLFSFLKNHVEMYTKNSFNDIGLSLETLFMDLLNKIEGKSDWENINTISFNYPAIDLVNINKKQALQITTAANKKKIDRTVAVYKKNNIIYDSLLIIGFLSHSKYNQNNISSVGIDYITEQIRGCSLSLKKEILNMIREYIPLQLLVPFSDKNCFEIIFNNINRSAIRDDRHCEGSYDQMVEGLKEVKSLITSGQIKNSDIRTKPLSCYMEPLQTNLSEIENKISKIIQICNKSHTGGLVYLNSENKIIIDELKDEIINKTNEISKQMNLNKRIVK